MRKELEEVLHHLEEVDIDAMLAENDNSEFELEAEAVPDETSKLTQEYAGYMELEGAKKDALCHIVEGDISSEKGCCNVYTPKPKADSFGCGHCKFVNKKAV